MSNRYTCENFGQQSPPGPPYQATSAPPRLMHAHDIRLVAPWTMLRQTPYIPWLGHALKKCSQSIVPRQCWGTSANNLGTIVRTRNRTYPGPHSLVKPNSALVTTTPSGPYFSGYYFYYIVFWFDPICKETVMFLLQTLDVKMRT